jgi:hypothetical protein
MDEGEGGQPKSDQSRITSEARRWLREIRLRQERKRQQTDLIRALQAKYGGPTGDR